jgi:hypothetical protein
MTRTTRSTTKEGSTFRETNPADMMENGRRSRLFRPIATPRFGMPSRRVIRVIFGDVPRPASLSLRLRCKGNFAHKAFRPPVEVHFTL